MSRRLTITVDEDVYAGLQAKVGPRGISRFLNDLARPFVSQAAPEPAPASELDIEDLLAEVDNDGC